MKFTASQIAEFVSGIVEGDKGVKIDKLSKIYGLSNSEIISQTTLNANDIFNFNN